MTLRVVFAMFLCLASGQPGRDNYFPTIPGMTKLGVPESSSKFCVKCETDPPPNMRDDYVFTAGIGAHKMHNIKATWNDARRICVEEGGQLVVINSELEDLAINDLYEKTKRIYKGNIDQQAFIGIHDIFEDGDWVTVNGIPLSSIGYTSWIPGQPDNHRLEEDCGTWFYNRGFNDVPCTMRLPFFCEISIQ